MKVREVWICYLSTNTNRIHSILGNKVQFQIHTDADMLGLPYDYESVMHYPFNAFAKNPNLPTIIPTTKNARIGQTKNLSPIDILRIQLAYKCNGASSDQQSGRSTKNFRVPLSLYYRYIPHQSFRPLIPDLTGSAVEVRDFRMDKGWSLSPLHRFMGVGAKKFKSSVFACFFPRDL